MRRRLREAYLAFVLAYRAAALRYRQGEIGVCFPEGCFPPPRRFGYAWHPPPA
jgi:hypothetical protein